MRNNDAVTHCIAGCVALLIIIAVNIGFILLIAYILAWFLSAAGIIPVDLWPHVVSR